MTSSRLCTLPLLLAAIVLPVGPAAAADWPTPWDTGLQAREVVAIGLPSVTQSIAQTQDGYVWFASMNGLFRHDGNRPSRVETGRAGPAVRQLLAVRAGQLWIGAGGGYLDVPTSADAPYTVGLREGTGGLLLHARGGVREILPADGAPEHWVWALGELDNGRVAVGTENGLWIVGADPNVPATRVPLPGTHDFDRFVPALLVRREQGRETLWFATASGVWRWHTDGQLAPERIFDTQGARQLAAAPGGFWIVQDDVLARVRDQTIVERIVATQAEQFRCVLDDDEADAPWVGTTFGLQRLRNGKLQRAEESLPKQTVRTLLRDREGSVWAAVKGLGVALLRVAAVKQLGRAEGLSSDAVLSVLAPAARINETTANLWLTSADGLVGVAQGKATLHPVPANSPNRRLRNLAEQTDGTLWLGWDHLVRYRNGEAVQHSAADVGGAVRAVFVDQNDGLWVGLLQGGVVHFASGHVDEKGKKYAADAGVCAGPVSFIARGAHNTLWFVGADGASRFDTQSDRAHCFESRTFATTFTGVFEDVGGTTWVTAVGDRGLLRIRGNDIVTVPPAAFPPRALYAVLGGSDGYLWFTSYQGVYRAAADELNAWVDNAGPPPAVFHVDSEVGMRSSDCQSAFSPTIGPWGQGGVMVATALGLVAIKPPEALPKPHIAPFIQSVLIDGVPMDAKGTIPPATQRVEISFAAPTFLAARRPRFEQRIDGLDSQWRSVGEARSVQLTKPAPGHYTFRLRLAQGYRQPAAEAMVAFRVLAPWYRRPVALAAGVIAIVVALLGSYQLRVRQLANRFRAIANERNRIARDWHDGLSQVFLGIAYQLEALRLRLNSGSPADPKVATIIDDTKAMVKDAQEGVKSVLWDLRGGSGDNALMTRMKALADKTHERLGVFVEVRASGSLPASGVLTEEWPHIAKEAITNAVKHGRASAVRIVLAFTPTAATMTINDNGSGPPPQTAGEPGGRGLSFGLIGMRERAQRCGGELFVEPGTEAGMQLRVVVSLTTHG